MQNSAARESLISQGNFAVAYAGIPFTELSDRTRNLQLKQNLWKIMIRTFSTGMKKQWYILMAVGIRMLISHRVDERLSDTGMRG